MWAGFNMHLILIQTMSFLIMQSPMNKLIWHAGNSLEKLSLIEFKKSKITD
jgi:hypothetical protein